MRYETDRDKQFPATIKSMPGCEDMDKCIQCGTCSGTCPVSIYMDHPPRRIIELTRHGFKNDVLKSKTIWLCASCYQCTVDCPKEIGITDIMYALKQKAIEEGVYPKRFPIPTLAREFFKMVKQYGRVSEGKLATVLFARTDFFKLFGMHKLGFDLIRTGRFSLKTESMKKPASLQKVLNSLKKNQNGGSAR